MLTHTQYECPICGGAVPREHHAIANLPDRRDEWLYCESCERGWETSTYPDGDVFPLDFVRRTEPKQFDKFL